MSNDLTLQLTKEIYDKYKIPYSIIEVSNQQVLDIDLDLIEDGEKMDDFRAANEEVRLMHKRQYTSSQDYD